MSFQFDWLGPFSVLEGASTPSVFTSDVEAARHPGVYLWTVPCGDEELVLYVGRTTRGLRMRLSEELRWRRKKAWDWFPDPHERRVRVRRPDCWDWIPDPVQLGQGVKVWLYEPWGWQEPDLVKWVADEPFHADRWRQYLQLLHVYISPMPGSSCQVIKDAETALMWSVWDHEDVLRQPTTREGYFLTNEAIPYRLPYEYQIRSSAANRIRGIGWAAPV
ncbi:MAG: hypothetical protein K2X87_07165 [Gemmataceae bacterium]|nr:hypothetical protein [Gemmataceae bacterium]